MCALAYLVSWCCSRCPALPHARWSFCARRLRGYGGAPGGARAQGREGAPGVDWPTARKTGVRDQLRAILWCGKTRF
ncbi:hypothetical protein B0T18DRAFT_417229 [Schizothecium vesticola]|uniref:Uncharacterized protein n=1 Tax=Schizothecium vesticola TaxID=314040 RepID=A0AA40BTJ6_9PEZI|nr:hypothetical protein B0T18DRAFT_417229 [Schizothecium vesticola]